MEASTSQTFDHGKNPVGISDYEGIISSFGSFGLGKDGTLRPGATASDRNNGSLISASNSYSVFSNQTLEEGVANDINSKKIKNPWLMASQETADTTQKNSVSDHDSIWGYRYFVSGGEDFVSNLHNYQPNSLVGSMDSQHSYFNFASAPENFGAGSTSEQSMINSFYDRPSTSNFANQFNSSPFLHDNPSFMPIGLDTLENYQYREIQNNGLFSEIEDYTMNNDLMTSDGLWNHNGSSGFTKPESQMNFNCLQEILKGGDHYMQKESMFGMLEGSIILTMIDEQMHFFFQKLVDSCEGEQLNSLVGEVLSGGGELFINVAFCKQGATSIVKLIKKVKKTNHAFAVTTILSTRLFDIMTHHTARVVIQQCLNLFGSRPNKILYEKAIDHFQELAIHKVGCRSLNECIDTISGDERMRLLNHIADASDYLSNDPYGNYVVQHVLGLKNDFITAKMLCRLRGQFIQLAQKKGGSHIVEKCIESSELGTTFVVQEIVNSPKAAFLLARDQFGNYVIQRALEKTKKQGDIVLYKSLIQSLEPYYQALYRTTGGKNVINLLKGDVQLKGRSSINGKVIASDI